ncbi:MAG: sugar phosphate isomerase/epimerase [Verrucomicrobia bacterium]|jgi:hexulose-6-phosphate isomerase|nr:sugar phosphate isomerase/epimerase [Verrucomicrobiota bacterium]OQC66843.1 MAG: Xylose isomerase-like TIM barrel [Verrucomicrobia bacterium ADurb.Bin006]MDI9380058.1 sugar phosphate isomerase/epimerase family protein [Verrucomicrobiota bacterium]NMD19371.1 sugar phosphate isomerase/epimerase [Verrucomicrobiota bacterium]HNU99000.1 sugar phosphate isomerase/epimerase family protein [Verrucomicrobiota bacterium]
MTRRQFISNSASLLGGLSLGTVTASRAAWSAESTPPAGLKRALILSKPTEASLAALKNAGFDGAEAGILPPSDAEECRAWAEKLGLRIHSVLRGWAEFNSPDAAKVESSLKVTEDALRAAEAYGADAVLLVPCRIGGMKMPRAWEFHLEFDEATGHLREVVAGDNRPYADYIDAHNRAIDASTEAVKRLIPVAEKTGVVIAIENVWNNLWVRPAHFRHFVASFRSPWVRAYYDIGNHVKYAPSEQWILELGSLLAKVHVKDFKLAPADPAGGGEFVNIRDGSVRWPVVRAALDCVNYRDWLTIEGGDLSMEEHRHRLDLIIEGK